LGKDVFGCANHARAVADVFHNAVVRARLTHHQGQILLWGNRRVNERRERREFVSQAHQAGDVPSSSVEAAKPESLADIQLSPQASAVRWLYAAVSNMGAPFVITSVCS
jgi:hypothetical protein